MPEKINEVPTEPTLDDLRAAVAEARRSEANSTMLSYGRTPYSGWTEELSKSFSFSILIFGIVVLILVTFLIWKSKANPNSITRAFGLVLIIVAAVFLVVAGYTQEQIAPVIGLLGAIAGYLLGSDSKRSKAEKEIPEKK